MDNLDSPLYQEHLRQAAEVTGLLEDWCAASCQISNALGELQSALWAGDFDAVVLGVEKVKTLAHTLRELNRKVKELDRPDVVREEAVQGLENWLEDWLKD
jgi:hypothetical protein